MRYATISFASLLVLFAGGCRETVDTRLEIEQPFSIFGIINPKSDTHAVRLFEIKTHITLVQPQPIDAVVTTTRMDTGERQAWQDSVVRLDNRDYRHVYWATFGANAGETYRLEVVRSDGATSTAITTVPPPISLEPLEADTLKPGEAIMPVLIRGNAPTLPRIDVEYVIVGFAPGGSSPIFRPIVFNYATQQVPHPDGFLLNIDMFQDYTEIYRVFDRDNSVSTDIIDLRQINVTIHVGDKNWASPIGVFDAEYLVEPGTFSNVDNGFGYFGSGYTESVTFRPPLVLIRRAGFYIVGENTPGQ